MTSRTDEAVGVGGTGASNWSEPTKSSSMDLKDYIPEAKQDDLEKHVEKELATDTSAVPEDLPLGMAGEQEGALDPSFDDPLMAFITSPDNYSPGRGKAGRPKGAKTDKARAERRKNPETTVTPATPEEIQAIEDLYGQAMADLAATEQSGGFEDYAKRKGEAPKLAYEYVPDSEGEALEKKATAIGALHNKGKRDVPGLNDLELKRLQKWWAQQSEAERSFDPEDVSFKPSVADVLGKKYPEINDIELPGKKKIFVFPEVQEFQGSEPEAFEAFKSTGYDPNYGSFMMLKGGFKKPDTPQTLVPSSPGYNEDEAARYYSRLLVHHLSQHAGRMPTLFWTSTRDFPNEDIEDGIDFRFDRETGTWEEVNVADTSKLPPEPEQEQSADDWWNREFAELETDEEGNVTKYGSRGYVHPEERKDLKKDVSTKSPLAADDLHGMDVDAAGFTMPDEPEAEAQPAHTPGRLSRWELDQLKKGKKLSQMPSHAPFDAPEDEWPDYEGIRETFEMKLNEFFELDEAQGERASRLAHGHGSHEIDKSEFQQPDQDPDGMLGFEGGEPGDEMQFQGGDEFEDPTSSQDNETHDDLPDAQGGSIEAPPGVFQDAGGFGDMDMVPDEEGNEPPMEGGPDDESIAGEMGDPGFGAEGDDWGREHQTGEPGPEHRTRVNFPKYEDPRLQKRSGKGW